jgi:hypothetical protein
LRFYAGGQIVQRGTRNPQQNPRQKSRR